MKPLIRFGKALGLLGLCWLIMGTSADCDQNQQVVLDTDDSDRPPPVSSADNAATVAAALATTEQMLGQQAGLADTQAAVLAQLRADPQVLGADLDSAGEDIIWADFKNGETHIFSIIDRASDAAEGDVSELTTAAAAPAARRQKALTLRSAGNGQTTALPADLDVPFHRLPASNRALLANGLTPFHADWDITSTTSRVNFMLEGRGYIGDVKPLTLDVFDEITKYGVILLEAHGTWRDLEYPQEWMFPSATCGGDGSRMVLLTLTPTTAESLVEDAADIVCGRLVPWHVTLTNPDGTVTEQDNYGVTPNYVREHVKGRFPDNTLMILNACRGFNASFVSPWQELLAEKCDTGATFMGWTDRVRYPWAARAMLNLFQLATVSDDELSIKGVTLLEKATPPRGGPSAGVKAACNAIHKRGYAVYPKTGAMLTFRTQQDEMMELCLMPQALFWEDQRPWENSPGLGMYAERAPTITIGGSNVTVSPVSLCCSSGWNLTLPPGVYGDIVATEGERWGYPLVLHRWRPRIKVESTGGEGRQAVVNFILHARSGLDANSLRESPWEQPPPAFFSDTLWDAEACTIGWQVSGQSISPDGCAITTYQGSGLQTFDPSEYHGLLEVTSEAAGLRVHLAVEAPITYTMTSTDSCFGSSTTDDVTEQIVVDSDDAGTDVTLSADWTIGAASYTVPDSYGSGGDSISWGTCAAEPPFNSDTQPR